MKKELYVFKNLVVNKNMITFDFITIYKTGLNTKQRLSLYFTHFKSVNENYESLMNSIEPYIMVINDPCERKKVCNRILECVLYIVSMYIENPNLDHSNFEHVLCYSKYDEHETYTLEGSRYRSHSDDDRISYRYVHSLENRVNTQIKCIYRYIFMEKCNDVCKEQQIEKENNMEIFISKKKKDESLYLVFKNCGKAKTIKLPNELKKAFEKRACIKTIDENVLLVLPNKIRLFGITSNLKLDREDGKSIILSWLPEEKYRKMLFISFILLQIKTKLNYISIDKDIFERFKLTDTKTSYEKLYNITDLLAKINFGKNNYDCIKNDFSLN